MRPVLLVLAVVLASLPACGGSGSAAAGKDGGDKGKDDTLRIVLYSDPVSLNPYMSQAASDSFIYHQIFEGLVDVTASSEYVGRLSEGYRFSEDGKELVFDLRKDVRWHDGEPFTSADVRFTYDYIQSFADPSYKASMAEVEAVDAPAPDKVRVRYKAPFAPALSAWTAYILPEHLFPKDRSIDRSSEMFRGVGTGPYKVAGRTVGDSIALDRNPDFKRPVPYFGHVVFKVMSDSMTALQAVRDGTFDVARMRPTDYGENTPDAEWRSFVQKIANPSIGYSYVGWNADGSNPFFSDRRVRRAMALAFNPREGLGLLNEAAQIAYGPYPASSKYFSRSLRPLPYDPDNAKRELDAAGFSDHDGDGIRDRDGIPFKFKMLTLDNMPFTNEVAHLLSMKLQEVGVKLDYVRVSYPEMMQRLLSGKFESYVLEWSGDVDPDLFAIFHSSQHGKGDNYVAYVSPEVDKLLEEGRRELSDEKRRAIYARVHELIYDDQPYLFLYYTPTFWGVSARIQGARAEPGGIPLGYPGLLEWRATRPAGASSAPPLKTQENPAPSK